MLGKPEAWATAKSLRLLNPLEEMARELAKGKREQGNAEELLERLMEHMQGFNPSVKWPEIEVYVSVPKVGLAAIWQSGIKDGV